MSEQLEAARGAAGEGDLDGAPALGRHLDCQLTKHTPAP